MNNASKSENREKGLQGEELAAKYLMDHGYQIIGKNVRSGGTEIDLIAENKTHIVFVEVKTRFSNGYGGPWEAVNNAKRKRLCAGANFYIREKDCEKEPRFDIVSITHVGKTTDIQHIEDAFYPRAQ